MPAADSHIRAAVRICAGRPLRGRREGETSDEPASSADARPLLHGRPRHPPAPCGRARAHPHQEDGRAEKFGGRVVGIQLPDSRKRGILLKGAPHTAS